MTISWRTPIHLFRSAYHAALYAIAARPMIAPKLLQRSRQNICLSCPHYKDLQCLKCQCFTYLKVKLSSESCPDDPPRWKALTDPIPDDN